MDIGQIEINFYVAGCPEIGLEADLILDNGRDRWAIEVKFTSEPSSRDVEALKRAAALVDANRMAILCRAATATSAGPLLIAPLQELLSRLIR